MTGAVKKALVAEGLINACDTVTLTPFKSCEDGSDYEVWSVDTKGLKYVLKKARGNELWIYSHYFSEKTPNVPKFIRSLSIDSQDYFIMTYEPGEDMCNCNREALTAAVDAIVSIQKKFWNACGDSPQQDFKEHLERRIKRSEYLGHPEIEEAYAEFLESFKRTERTLCHDDLLPFNVLISDGKATIIDWEVAGILPYPTPIARLIAHAEQKDDAFFYMKDSDKAFAVDHYYNTFIKDKGIPYSDYRHTLDLFLLYEYCEWIMLGNKYADCNAERFEHYKTKALQHIKMMKETKY